MSSMCAATREGRRDARGEAGFTLVELLIVIVLLGIIATVTVFAVRGVSTRGKTNACLMDRRMLETAAEAYLVGEATSSPASEADLVTAGYLRAPSPNFDFDVSGNVVAQAGNPNDCV